jgi:hypothetical protein
LTNDFTSLTTLLAGFTLFITYDLLVLRATVTNNYCLETMLSNKKEKEAVVVKSHQENKTIRQIAKIVYMSFKDIGAIIRRIDGIANDSVYTNMSTNLKQHRQCFYLRLARNQLMLR